MPDKPVELGISSEAVSMIIRDQLLRDFVDAGSMKPDEVQAAQVAKAVKTKKKGEPEVEPTAWILVKDTTVITAGSGTIRLRAGHRVEDLHVKRLLDDVGAQLTPTL